MTHTTRIHIGDEWVDVPPEYIKKEADHCRELLDQYYLAATDDNVDEEEYARLRQATLDCRVEFWKQWNDTITNNNNENNNNVHKSQDSNS